MYTPAFKALCTERGSWPIACHPLLISSPRSATIEAEIEALRNDYRHEPKDHIVKRAETLKAVLKRHPQWATENNPHLQEDVENALL